MICLKERCFIRKLRVLSQSQLYQSSSTCSKKIEKIKFKVKVIYENGIRHELFFVLFFCKIWKMDYNPFLILLQIIVLFYLILHTYVQYHVGSYRKILFCCLIFCLVIKLFLTDLFVILDIISILLLF